MIIIAMLVLNALHFTQSAIKMCYRLSHLFLLQESSLFDFAAIKWKLQFFSLLVHCNIGHTLCNNNYLLKCLLQNLC